MAHLSLSLLEALSGYTGRTTDYRVSGEQSTGAVCRDRGDLDGARWEQAAAQWEKSGLVHELARTRSLMESTVAGQSGR